jgi:hypothetical protein
VRHSNNAALPGEMFGESGKNFIEIGKRPSVRETMLRRAVPLGQMEFAWWEKQCRNANLEKAMKVSALGLGCMGMSFLVRSCER